MPVAWMWPPGYGEIHTSSQAGGITSSLMRPRTSASSTDVPSGLRYWKPLPRRRRRMPGSDVSERRRRIAGGLESRESRLARFAGVATRGAYLVFAGALRLVGAFFFGAALAGVASSPRPALTASRLAFSADMRSGTGAS